MRWNQLTPEIASLAGESISDPAITGIEYDSRRVVPGSVFVAMQGGTTDGNRYVASAIAASAAGIITDSPQAYARLASEHAIIPRLLVNHGRQALAQASSAFFHHPEKLLRATGVTGTNGKTTTAFLIEALLNAANCSTILVGTIEYHVAGNVRPSAHTTPESRDLFALMAEGVSLGATELVMEVSSHALDQGRVACVGFDVAVFTNLTPDHLDYHHTMEEYFAAKRLLFDGARYPAPRVAVFNAADGQTPELARAASLAGSKVITYGLHGEAADWRAEEIRLTPAGVEFTLATQAGTARIHSRLAGEVNVRNLLAALAAAHARGVAFDRLIQAVPALEPVPGRFQAVNAGQPFTVIVDYAHTEDALQNLTALARQLTLSHPQGGRVITMFGCGGDRDRTKRPRMGFAAGRGSDFVVVTSDNPRSEDPDAIIAEIMPGVADSAVRYAVEPDRASAIALSLHEAQPGDVVLLAGKGHEKVQVLRTGEVFFDDAQVALAALHSLGYGEVQ